MCVSIHHEGIGLHALYVHINENSFVPLGFLHNVPDYGCGDVEESQK